MALPVNANPLNPPPITGNKAFDAWARELYLKIGQATNKAPVSISGDADGTSANITGILASAHASPNLVRNITNDGTADSIDAGADATVRVYGPGGVGSNWSAYRNGGLLASYAAVTFTGKAYSTRYYIGFDTSLSSWTISTAFKDVTGDNMIVFSVETVAAGGGGGLSGGGAPALGGTGGYKSGGTFLAY